MTAIVPSGEYAFVTHGGDGIISVIDVKQKKVVHKIKTPTKLNYGGYMIGVEPGQTTADTIGR